MSAQKSSKYFSAWYFHSGQSGPQSRLQGVQLHRAVLQAPDWRLQYAAYQAGKCCIYDHSTVGKGYRGDVGRVIHGRCHIMASSCCAVMDSTVGVNTPQTSSCALLWKQGAVKQRLLSRQISMKLFLSFSLAGVRLWLKTEAWLLWEIQFRGTDGAEKKYIATLVG